MMEMILRGVLGGIAFLAFEIAFAESPSHPMSSFESAKRVALNVIYADHTVDFYCNCEFTPAIKGSSGVIDAASCGYSPRKSKTRGKKLEWEHVVPASFFGAKRACWKKGNPKCENSDGVAYKGRRCCSKVDKVFKKIEADLHNLTPAVGELNGDRNDLPYGMVEGEPRQYGQCDFEIGGSPKVVEPRPAVRGDAARTWLYMSDTYGIPLTEEQRAMFEEWSQMDRPDRWERLRNDRIEAAQGNHNDYVD